MAVIGTFGSFTAARLGIYASQASLNVTGNNIANINTKGYTRQRMDLVSLYSGGADRYANMFNMNVGYGVLCSGVSQLRDPYLDIRFRNEQASLGEQAAKLNGLSDLSAILDEVGKGDYDFGIIENQLNDFKSQLQTLTGKIGSEEYDTLVRSSAATLVKLFNTAAKDLDVQYDNTVDKLKTDIKDVNTILSNIRDLNVQIRDAALYGDKALELRDTRNVLIDELSSYMKIDVTYTTEKIDQYSEVEKIVINLADTSPAVNLVDGIYATQLMMPEELPKPNPDYDPTDPRGMAYLDWSGKPTDNPREAAPVLNPNDGKYLDMTTVPPTPTNDKDVASKQENPTKDCPYLDENGEPTTDLAKAAVRLNPDKTDTTNLYLDKDGKPTANRADGAILNPGHNMQWLDSKGKPTNDKDKAALVKNDNRQQYLDKDGNPTNDINEAALKENPDYEDDFIGGMKYLDKDDNPTDKEEDAAKVPNAMDGEKDLNMYRIQLDALKDAKGRCRRDEHNRVINEIVDIDDVTLQGSLQALRELLTEEGEFVSEEDLKFDPEAAIKRGIPYYEKTLDFLAKTFAEAFNEANQIEPETIYKMEKHVSGKDAFVDKDGNFISGADGKLMSPVNGNVDPEVLKEKGVLKEEYAYYDGGVLFSNNGAGNDTANIDARNISISKGWGETTVRVLNTKEPNINGNTTKGSNIKHMINLMNEKVTYYTDEVQADASHGKYFVGTFQEMYRNISTTLADDRRTTTILYNSFDGEVLSLENNRQSVSGVDLNEEATNMMQFQKSYSAACRLLTTIDSMLDKLINGTAI
ncbi:MAG: hypothetical protein HFF61_05115 [Oscillospiraceae bacterium]|nr:hypothetical protein [Oscillospiraceae bacterium]